jgi:hypothetical protein
MKTKQIETIVTFLAADHWHRVSKVEWRTKVTVEHTEDGDVFTMDYEVEWLKAVQHYKLLAHVVDLSGLDVFDALIPYKDPIYGLKIKNVDDRVPVSKRDAEIVELRT